jgi:tetratricopeptide (TPR) repeat protein
MKKRRFIAALMAAQFAISAAFTISESGAEPISGSDSAADPWRTRAPTHRLAEAEARFKSQDFDGALRLFQEAVRNNSDLPPAQVIMGQLFFEAEMPEKARPALEQAVRDEPNDPESYVLLAMLAMRAHDVDKANELYQKANRLMSSFNKSAKRKKSLQPLIYSGLVAAAIARKDWAAANEFLDARLKLDPKNAEALQQVAYCLFQQKNVEGALAKLREAAKVQTDLPAPEAILARFYQWTNDRENAAKWLTTAVTRDPTNLKNQLAAGRLALEMGQLDKAHKHASLAMRIDPQSLEANLFRAEVALCQKDYEIAQFNLESAIQRLPRSFVSNKLALALIGQKDEAKGRRALRIAEANARQYPKSAELASTYGWVLYRLGRLDDAEKALRIAAPIADSNVDTAYIFARVAIARGRKAEAKRLLERALKNEKPSPFLQEARDLLKQLNE